MPKGVYPHQGRKWTDESKARVSQTKVRHGHTAYRTISPTYAAWTNMLRRCTNPAYMNYRYYGGRGITVCARWRRFENFLADMGECPEGLTLDRMDSESNYEPSNCRWATRKEQAQNRRPRVEEGLPG